MSDEQDEAIALRYDRARGELPDGWERFIEDYIALRVSNERSGGVAVADPKSESNTQKYQAALSYLSTDTIKGFAEDYVELRVRKELEEPQQTQAASEPAAREGGFVGRTSRNGFGPNMGG